MTEEMTMLPKLKVWEVDYDFIIKNYLDKSLWGKTWNLFEYKNFVVSMELEYISVKNEKITMELIIKDKETGYIRINYVSYSLKTDNLEILKNQINGGIFTLITSLEQEFIKRDTGYKVIEDSRDTERERLTEIANNFLDDNGVSNSEIREVYVDNYVSNNERTDGLLSNYVNKSKYMFLTDLYLIFTKTVDDNERYEDVIDSVKNEKNIKSILNEVDEYMKYMETEEFKSDMERELDGI